MIELKYGAPAYCAYTGTDDATVSVRIIEMGEPAEWVSRKDFLIVRSTFNKWMRGTDNAECPWMWGIENVFRAALPTDVAQWLAERPHRIRIVWTSENDKAGYAIPKFDVVSLAFDNSADALLFKLTF